MKSVLASATRIYAGQLAVLRRNCPESKLVARMAAQEERHLKRFNALMAERRVRPTALQPLWNVAGFALGAATALTLEEFRSLPSPGPGGAGAGRPSPTGVREDGFPREKKGQQGPGAEREPAARRDPR